MNCVTAAWTDFNTNAVSKKNKNNMYFKHSVTGQKSNYSRMPATNPNLTGGKRQLQ